TALPGRSGRQDDAASIRRPAVARIASRSANAASVQAREDHAANLVSCVAAQLGFARGDERRSASRRGKKFGSQRHENGRTALWPSCAFLCCRCDSRWRAAVRDSSEEQCPADRLTVAWPVLQKRSSSG